MKIELPAKGLKKAPPIVARATAKRSGSANPYAHSILFEAEEEVLTLTATDTEISLKLRAPVQVREEGKVALNSSVLSELVKSLPDEGEVSLEGVRPVRRVRQPRRQAETMPTSARRQASRVSRSSSEGAAR